jgi:Protein of unknown function (DUF1501)
MSNNTNRGLDGRSPHEACEGEGCDQGGRVDEERVINPGRRRAILDGLFGAGWLGLRALACGVPAAVLANPRRALADDSSACFSKAKAQYLILSTSGSGDPLNANVPGTYAFPDIAHPPDPLMAKTQFKLGGSTVEAAAPWSTLPQALLDRTSFFHHTTLTNSHANQPKVMRLMGATKRQEMLVSFFAGQLAPCLGTVQVEPVVVGASGSGEFLSYQGRVLPALSPSALRDTLANPAGPLGTLQALRDQDLNRLNALFKAHGTTEQRTFLDRLATTQTEARGISQALLENLASITANDADNQVLAAVTLIKMNVTPVVSMHLPFGGDNHTDTDLAGETKQTVAATATMALLYQKLTDLGLQDQVTFAAMNVFGRTLAKKGTTGRDHLANHHATVMFGKGIAPGVIGGLEPKAGDYSAMSIVSATGAGSDTGDIAFEDTLGALGKTLGTAIGVSPAALDDFINVGKPVTAALA